jgi:hypothetical protein
MSSVAPVEVERYHVKLIHQMLDVCPAKNAEDIKNFLRVMLKQTV